MREGKVGRCQQSLFSLLEQPIGKCNCHLILIWFWCFNTTFKNISWRPVLVVEEAGVPGEDHHHGQATGTLYHMRLRVECTIFCNLQSRAWAHSVLVIGLYELLVPATSLIKATRAPNCHMNIHYFRVVH
jgi:hypothetical protein